MAKKRKVDSSEPYPELGRPTPAECQTVRDALSALHGARSPPIQELADEKAVQGVLEQTTKDDGVLDSLVRTILSQNTTDTTSHRAFSKLKKHFPTWEDVMQAPAEQVEEAIKEGGLAKTKAARMQAILSKLQEERGVCSLEHLRSMTDDEIKQDLSRFKGVGSKTIACVLMFCLGSHEFPVDTHVWRITKSLGWVPDKATRDETYEHLNKRIPDQLKYELHVLLVEHGKRCERCAKNGRPRKEVQGPCPLKKAKLQVAEDKSAIADQGQVRVKEEDSSAEPPRLESPSQQGDDENQKPAMKAEKGPAGNDSAQVKTEDGQSEGEHGQRQQSQAGSKAQSKGKCSGASAPAVQSKRTRSRK